ncbi:hypothetical protein SNEBB_008437 [Seison nebaliae]|nr:hypothetical protein SNEBB_008437 [Seison nebaliae]
MGNRLSDEVMKSVTAQLIRQYLGNIFETKIKKEQLDLHLRKGQITLKKLKLDVNYLNELLHNLLQENGEIDGLGDDDCEDESSSSSSDSEDSSRSESDRSSVNDGSLITTITKTGSERLRTKKFSISDHTKKKKRKKKRRRLKRIDDSKFPILITSGFVEELNVKCSIFSFQDIFRLQIKGIRISVSLNEEYSHRLKEKSFTTDELIGSVINHIQNQSTRLYDRMELSMKQLEQYQSADSENESELQSTMDSKSNISSIASSLLSAKSNFTNNTVHSSTNKSDTSHTSQFFFEEKRKNDQLLESTKNMHEMVESILKNFIFVAEDIEILIDVIPMNERDSSARLPSINLKFSRIEFFDADIDSPFDETKNEKYMKKNENRGNFGQITDGRLSKKINLIDFTVSLVEVLDYKSTSQLLIDTLKQRRSVIRNRHNSKLKESIRNRKKETNRKRQETLRPTDTVYNNDDILKENYQRYMYGIGPVFEKKIDSSESFSDDSNSNDKINTSLYFNQEINDTIKSYSEDDNDDDDDDDDDDDNDDDDDEVQQQFLTNGKDLYLTKVPILRIGSAIKLLIHLDEEKVPSRVRDKFRRSGITEKVIRITSSIPNINMLLSPRQFYQLIDIINVSSKIINDLVSSTTSHSNQIPLNDFHPMRMNCRETEETFMDSLYLDAQNEMETGSLISSSHTKSSRTDKKSSMNFSTTNSTRRRKKKCFRQTTEMSMEEHLHKHIDLYFNSSPTNLNQLEVGIDMKCFTFTLLSNDYRYELSNEKCVRLYECLLKNLKDYEKNQSKCRQFRHHPNYLAKYQAKFVTIKYDIDKCVDDLKNYLRSIENDEDKLLYSIRHYEIGKNYFEELESIQNDHLKKMDVYVNQRNSNDSTLSNLNRSQYLFNAYQSLCKGINRFMIIVNHINLKLNDTLKTMKSEYGSLFRYHLVIQSAPIILEFVNDYYGNKSKRSNLYVLDENEKRKLKKEILEDGRESTIDKDNGEMDKIQTITIPILVDDLKKRQRTFDQQKYQSSGAAIEINGWFFSPDTIRHTVNFRYLSQYHWMKCTCFINLFVELDVKIMDRWNYFSNHPLIPFIEQSSKKGNNEGDDDDYYDDNNNNTSFKEKKPENCLFCSVEENWNNQISTGGISCQLKSISVRILVPSSSISLDRSGWLNEEENEERGDDERKNKKFEELKEIMKFQSRCPWLSYDDNCQSYFLLFFQHINLTVKYNSEDKIFICKSKQMEKCLEKNKLNDKYYKLLPMNEMIVEMEKTEVHYYQLNKSNKFKRTTSSSFSSELQEIEKKLMNEGRHLLLKLDGFEELLPTVIFQFNSLPQHQLFNQKFNIHSHKHMTMTLIDFTKGIRQRHNSSNDNDHYFQRQTSYTNGQLKNTLQCHETNEYLPFQFESMNNNNNNNGTNNNNNNNNNNGINNRQLNDNGTFPLLNSFTFDQLLNWRERSSSIWLRDPTEKISNNRYRTPSKNISLNNYHTGSLSTLNIQLPMLLLFVGNGETLNKLQIDFIDRLISFELNANRFVSIIFEKSPIKKRPLITSDFDMERSSMFYSTVDTMAQSSSSTSLMSTTSSNSSRSTMRNICDNTSSSPISSKSFPRNNLPSNFQLNISIMKSCDIILDLFDEEKKKKNKEFLWFDFKSLEMTLVDSFSCDPRLSYIAVSALQPRMRKIYRHLPNQPHFTTTDYSSKRRQSSYDDEMCESMKGSYRSSHVDGNGKLMEEMKLSINKKSSMVIDGHNRYRKKDSQFIELILESHRDSQISVSLRIFSNLHTTSMDGEKYSLKLEKKNKLNLLLDEMRMEENDEFISKTGIETRKKELNRMKNIIHLALNLSSLKFHLHLTHIDSFWLMEIIDYFSCQTIDSNNKINEENNNDEKKNKSKRIEKKKNENNSEIYMNINSTNSVVYYKPLFIEPSMETKLYWKSISFKALLHDDDEPINFDAFIDRLQFLLSLNGSGSYVKMLESVGLSFHMTIWKNEEKMNGMNEKLKEHLLNHLFQQTFDNDKLFYDDNELEMERELIELLIRSFLQYRYRLLNNSLQSSSNSSLLGISLNDSQTSFYCCCDSMYYLIQFFAYSSHYGDFQFCHPSSPIPSPTPQIKSHSSDMSNSTFSTNRQDRINLLSSLHHKDSNRNLTELNEEIRRATDDHPISFNSQSDNQMTSSFQSTITTETMIDLRERSIEISSEIYHNNDVDDNDDEDDVIFDESNSISNFNDQNLIIDNPNKLIDYYDYLKDNNEDDEDNMSQFQGDISEIFEHNYDHSQSRKSSISPSLSSPKRMKEDIDINLLEVDPQYSAYDDHINYEENDLKSNENKSPLIDDDYNFVDSQWILPHLNGSEQLIHRHVQMIPLVIDENYLETFKKRTTSTTITSVLNDGNESRDKCNSLNTIQQYHMTNLLTKSRFLERQKFMLNHLMNHFNFEEWKLNNSNQLNDVTNLQLSSNCGERTVLKLALAVKDFSCSFVIFDGYDFDISEKIYNCKKRSSIPSTRDMNNYFRIHLSRFYLSYQQYDIDRYYRLFSNDIMQKFSNRLGKCSNGTLISDKKSLEKIAKKYSHIIKHFHDIDQNNDLEEDVYIHQIDSSNVQLLKYLIFLDEICELMKDIPFKDWQCLHMNCGDINITHNKNPSSGNVSSSEFNNCKSLSILSMLTSDKIPFSHQMNAIHFKLEATTINEQYNDNDRSSDLDSNLSLNQNPSNNTQSDTCELQIRLSIRPLYLDLNKDIIVFILTLINNLNRCHAHFSKFTSSLNQQSSERERINSTTTTTTTTSFGRTMNDQSQLLQSIPMEVKERIPSNTSSGVTATSSTLFIKRVIIAPAIYLRVDYSSNILETVQRHSAILTKSSGKVDDQNDDNRDNSTDSTIQRIKDNNDILDDQPLLMKILLDLASVHGLYLELIRIDDRSGFKSFDLMLNSILMKWKDHIQQNQSVKIVQSVSALKPFFQIAFGIHDLLAKPLRDSQTNETILGQFIQNVRSMADQAGVALYGAGNSSCNSVADLVDSFRRTMF